MSEMQFGAVVVVVVQASAGHRQQRLVEYRIGDDVWIWRIAAATDRLRIEQAHTAHAASDNTAVWQRRHRTGSMPRAVAAHRLPSVASVSAET